MDPARKDRENIKLLAIFHFIMSGLSFLGLLFLPMHYAFMNRMMNAPMMTQPQNGQPAPDPATMASFLDMFVWFYLGMGILIFVGAIMELLCGLFLLKKKHRMFCLVVSGLNCLSVPIGTALGICTIIVLTKDSVIASYEQARLERE